MSFWGFLLSLYGSWKKIWDFLHGWYGKARQVALYGASVSSSWLSKALNYAKLESLKVKSWALSAFGAVWNKLAQFENRLSQINLAHLLTFILAKLQSIRKYLDDKILAALQQAKAYALSFVNNLKQRVFVYVDSVKAILATFIGLWKWLLSVWGWLKQLFSILTGSGISKIVAFLSKMFDFLVMFVNDPLGFILGILRDDLLDFIFWLLALGLSYPDTINGNYKDYGKDAYLPGSGSIAVTGDGRQLPARPLTYISVSGYRFSPHHPGVDLGLAKGTPVYASHSGVVQVAGWSSVGYGNNVVISGNPWWTRYAHLEDYAVKRGESVSAGQLIGHGDSTGNSTGNHLHFEVKYNGRFVDPLTVIPPH